MLTITSISPTSGSSSSLVTITGTGFSEKDRVYFNGKKASIVNASETQLIVKVPPHAGTGIVFIAANEKSAPGPVFTFTGNTYLVSTFAGGSDNGIDGKGRKAGFYQPHSIAIDRHDNLYIAERYTRIRKITPKGVVTRFSGNNLWGFKDGAGAVARFEGPRGLAVDAADNVYVADVGNHLIRKITPDGAVSTFAGSGSFGSADGISPAATFFCPTDVAVDGGGNVFVADLINRQIRKVTPSGVVSTFAGSGEIGAADGTAATASFNSIYGICIDASGNLYVADSDNNNIRKITSDGNVTTIAGGTITDGYSDGYADGTGLSALFDDCRSIAVDGNGFLYVGDTGNDVIRQISPEGEVTLLAGVPGSKGTEDGPALTARFNRPEGVAIDSRGNIFVADSFNGLIRKLIPQ